MFTNVEIDMIEVHRTQQKKGRYKWPEGKAFSLSVSVIRYLTSL